MSDLRPPATGTEAYLEAILGELRVIRVALGDGLPGLVSGHVTATPAPSPATPGATPAKRTRTRTRGAAA